MERSQESGPPRTVGGRVSRTAPAGVWCYRVKEKEWRRPGLWPLQVTMTTRARF